MERDSEVLSGLVFGRLRDGRCRYDPQVNQELVRRCLPPGVSVARKAMQHGVNANLLRKWIIQRQSRNATAVQTVAPQDSSMFLAVQLSGAPNAGKAVPPSCVNSRWSATYWQRLQLGLPTTATRRLSRPRSDCSKPGRTTGSHHSKPPGSQPAVFTAGLTDLCASVRKPTSG